jgi:hypothetical protein
MKIAIEDIDFEFILNDKMFLGTLCKRGHDYENTGKSPRYKKVPGSCRICHEIRRRQWLVENSSRMKELQRTWNSSHKKHHAEWKRKFRKQKPFLRYLGRARRVSHIKENLIDASYLEEQWFKQDGKCYWLKVNLEIEAASNSLTKATLDRLIPEMGYTKENVVWASRFANIGRGNVPVKDFTAFLQVIL